jgi:hypothetical protein
VASPLLNRSGVRPFFLAWLALALILLGIGRLSRANERPGARLLAAVRHGGGRVPVY